MKTDTSGRNFGLERASSLLVAVYLAGRSYKHSQEGVTAIEYAMIAGLIAAVIIGAVASLGTHINLAYNSVRNF